MACDREQGGAVDGDTWGGVPQRLVISTPGEDPLGTLHDLLTDDVFRKGWPMRIVINPGHDGIRDKGARGPTGLNEAAVVQEVAAMMRSLGNYECKRQGIAGLWTLTRALRRNPPDVLVSLHCNAGSTCRHEAHFYFWDEDGDNRRRRDSFGLASAFAANCSFAEEAKVMEAPYQRKGRRRPFLPGILRDTATRAMVLVELGFITDPHVEVAMRTTDWRVRAANNLHQTLEAWGARLDV